MTNSSPLRGLIRCFDRWLSRRYRIFTFTDAPDCILRLQFGKALHTIVLNGHTIQKGEPVLGLHLWNDHLPSLSPQNHPSLDPDLTWAVKTQRLFIHSLRLVAETMKNDPRLSGLIAVYAATSLFTPERNLSGAHPMERMGFTVCPYHSPLGRFGDFWENLYAYVLAWAYNPVGPNRRQFKEIQRTEMWMLVEDLLSKYGLKNQQPRIPIEKSGFEYS